MTSSIMGQSSNSKRILFVALAIANTYQWLIGRWWDAGGQGYDDQDIPIGIHVFLFFLFHVQ
jgi:hypothetical protein